MILNTEIQNPSSSEVVRETETTTEVAAQKTAKVTNLSSEDRKGRVSQKHQQLGNDAHNVSETKKIETYKAASKKSVEKPECRTLDSTLEIERTATSTCTRP